MVQAKDIDNGFKVNDVVVWPREGVVERDGERIKLEPKVMAILVELARAPGEVIGRDDFANSVWRGRVVSDEVLSRDVSVLRSALGDDARAPHFIQTVPTVGYRLVADVSSLRQPGARWRVVAGMVLLAAVAGAYVWLDDGAEELPITTVAVLPFENLSDTRDAEYFSDGLADEVLGSLAQNPKLFVVARTSSFAFRGSTGDVREIGQTLGAGSILEGSVRKQGNAIRVSARLINANDGIQLWSQSFEGNLLDIFVVQDRISRAIVRNLVGTLSPGTTVRVTSTDDMEAYQLFLRANYHIHRRGVDGLQLGIELYEQAIARDANFGRAYVGLAEALTLLPGYTEERERPYLDRALSLLERAESTGEDGARLYAARAYAHYLDWHWKESRELFGQALAMAPNDSNINQLYSQFLASVGDIDRALQHAQLAVQSDPLSAVAHQRLGVLYLWANDVERSRKHMQLAVEMGLGELATPEAYIGLLAEEQSFDQAQVVLRQLQNKRGLGGEWIDVTMRAVRGDRGSVGPAISALGQAYQTGQIGPRLYLGALYFVGDPDGFFDGLERLIADDAPNVDLEFLFTHRTRAWRDSPRFDLALEQAGIAEYWRANGQADAAH